MKLSRYLLLPSLLMLNACITVQDVDVQTQEPAVVENRAVVNGEVLPLPDEPRISTQELPTGPTISPVAQTLLARADTQGQSGDWDSAANSLERALRLEPNNALLWSRLARVRYEQQDWQQAIQLSAKSNTLAANNENLRRSNWNRMANAHDALGNEDSAQEIRQQLSQ